MEAYEHPLHHDGIQQECDQRPNRYFENDLYSYIYSPRNIRSLYEKVYDNVATLLHFL